MATIFHVLVTSPLAHDDCRLAPNSAARPPQTRGLYACIRRPFPSEAKLTSLCRRREKEKKGHRVAAKLHIGDQADDGDGDG